MRNYALIIVALTMILDLMSLLKEEKRSSRIAAIISFCLYLPIWIYLLEN